MTSPDDRGEILRLELCDAFIEAATESLDSEIDDLMEGQ